MRLPYLLLGAMTLAACGPDPTLLLGVRRPVHLPGTNPSAAATQRAAIVPVGVTASLAFSPSPTGPSPVPVAIAVSDAPPPTSPPFPTAMPSPLVQLVAASQPPDTWQTGPGLQAARMGAIAGTVQGDLVVAEGEHRASLEWLSPDASAWRLVVAKDDGVGTDFPLGQRFCAGVQSADGLLVGAGGDDGDVLSTVRSYARDGASTQPALHAPAMAAAAGALGTTLCLAGGLDGQRLVTAAVQRIDLATGRYAAGAAMPLAVAGAACTTLAGKLYVLGGYVLAPDGSATPQTAVQIYDMAQDKWQRDGDGSTRSPAFLPLARHSAAAATVAGKVYLVGGAGVGASVLPTVSMYDPMTNAWTTLASLPTARALHALALHDGRLWAIGGRGVNGTALTSVELYQPPGDPS